MPGLVPGIHDLLVRPRRGWPGQARPWRSSKKALYCA